MEQMFSSTDVPAADRFAYWRECIARTHAPLEMASDHDSDYRARQHVLELGPVRVWKATCQPLEAQRTNRLIRQSDPGTYHLSLPLVGTARASHHRGQQTVLRPYELQMLDTARPYGIAHRTGALTGIGVELPKELLALPEKALAELMGLRMSGRDGTGALLAGFLVQLTQQPGSLEPGDGPRLGTVLLDLVTALTARALEAEDSLGPESRRRTLTLRIQAFMQQHLQDPSLSPPVIAAAHHISLSYLHGLFRETGSTVASWLRHQRLECSRRDLAEPALRATPVHAIAANRGFAHAADFSRAFRRTYGMSPTEYRYQALADAENN
ncbi:helix-turn-helix domain-containing protein [Streptomyces sp. WAC01526]|uniref:AraC-like ligand-binding domain-containing protein n=1 Tax=Streptomyces sp. WAC01526 TaxID=2588709 RepID=UPI0021CC6420|nr:helix-turn-helix domain-containing protein [Streptomyces sp. WAC01526]